MNQKIYIIKSISFVFILWICTACDREAHEYIKFINHSETPIWVHVGTYSVDPGDYGPILIDNYVEANGFLQIEPRGGFAWERSLYSGKMMLVCVYDESLSSKPEAESYKEFKQDHLLQESWYKIEDLNKLNWEINYYPEDKSDHDD